MKRICHLLFLVATIVSCSASMLDRLPKLLDAPLPSYPLEEKKDPHKAVVSVLLNVDEKGKATVEHVMTSSSYRFAEVVREKVAEWRFGPGRRDDKPAAFRIEYVFFFDPEKPVEISPALYE